MSAQQPLWYGADERDRILASMAENHTIYLNALRSFAREIALRNRDREVCIDDVRQLILERNFPMPADINCKSGERIFGVVFATKEFEPIGQILSRRPERVARSGRGSSMITVYRLREAACA